MSQRASRGSSTLLLFITLWPLWRIGDAPGPLGRCVWPLRTSPGSSRRHFGDVLGALGELWEDFLGAFFGVKSSSLQFQIGKRTRNVFQRHEIYKASCFKPHLKRIRWQKPVKSFCVSFAAAHNSLCCDCFFRGRRKWPQASRI